MRELLIRTVSGIVLLLILLGCLFFASSRAFPLLLLFIVAVGTFEMFRLLGLQGKSHFVLGEFCALGCYVISSLVAVNLLTPKFLSLDLIFLMIPFLHALFSKQFDFKHIASFHYGSMLFLSFPAALLNYMLSHDFQLELFGSYLGAGLILLVFALLWTNDIFAYLTGRLLGKHKLFERISPGKTIEGSLGGLFFTVLGMCIFCHYADWMPYLTGVGLAIVAVVFGTLGDLCESMLKRQAGVKDSGNLIPGHGGILDRFDSIMFSVPFVFTYLLLI